MTVAGTESAVLMVESEAKEMTEDEMLGAVLFGHQEMQAIIKAVAELAIQAGKEAWDWQAAAKDESLQETVASAIKADLGEAYRISDKMERQAAVSALRQKAVEKIAGEDADYSSDEVSDTFARVEKDLVRQRVLNGESEGAGEVATGHWVCGAYGNHHDLMFLKQWLAAAEAGARTVRQRGRSGGRGRGCVGVGPSVGGTFLACRSHEN